MNKTYAKKLVSTATPICYKDKNDDLYLGCPYYVVRFSGEEMPFKESGKDYESKVKMVFDKAVQNSTKNIELPVLEEMILETKNVRGSSQPRYDLAEITGNKENAPVVNAVYLTNILKMFGKKRPYAYFDHGNERSAVYMWNNDGIDAFLFPIKR